MLTGLALGRLGLLTPHSPVAWSDWVGWLELAVGIVALYSTAHVWFAIMAGALVLGVVKLSVVLITGADSLRGYGYISRTQCFGLILYCLITFALMLRLFEKRPAKFDRLALTVYLLTLWPAAKSPFSLWQSLGLLPLAAAWLVSRRRTTSQWPASAPAKNTG